MSQLTQPVQGGGHALLPVRAVLFDLDGTLADTAADLAAALNRVRADRALPPLPIAALRGYASHGARGLLAAGMGVTNDDADYKPLREAFLAYYESGLFWQSRLFDGAELVLDEIERRGMRWGIVTNKAQRFTLPLARYLALIPRAGTVICGDTTPYAKPHPAPLYAAANELGFDASDCVYVGDAERDVTAGIAAGMKTLIARYGYFAPEDAPERWPADGCIDSLPMLLDWLPRHPDDTAR
jgi:N-acetyl-D-muramate 6-phosphate phosphatase